MKKRNSGITLVALVITVIIMIIIASISIYEGRKIIATSKVQTLETNMLTIQAKVKAYAEEIDSKVWVYKNEEQNTKRNEEFSNKGMNTISIGENVLDQISDDIKSNAVAYEITGQVLTDMGLEEIKKDTYAVVFNKDDYKKMDLVYPNGVSYEGSVYYSLSKLQQKLENP